MAKFPPCARLVTLQIILLLSGHSPAAGQSMIAQNDGLTMSSREVDGTCVLTVSASNSRASGVLYRTRKPGMFLSYATPWYIQLGRKPLHCFFVAYEYGSGSSNRLTVIGPKADGRWGELLDVEAEVAYEFRPEIVDLLGDGVDDIIVVSALPRAAPDRPTALRNSRAQIWRWTPKSRSYKLVATKPFPERLSYRGTR